MNYMNFTFFLPVSIIVISSWAVSRLKSFIAKFIISGCSLKAIKKYLTILCMGMHEGKQNVTPPHNTFLIMTPTVAGLQHWHVYFDETEDTLGKR